MEKSMFLITSTWGEQKTFRMMPISNESPYAEAIYDPVSKTLAVIGKNKKESIQMLPKLNQFGDVDYLKVGKRNNGKEYSEERKVLETFYEYYVQTPEEIRSLVNILAFNSDLFDIEPFLAAEQEAQKMSSILLP